MVELLRNLTRSRSRTVLTLLGVAIGILALTLLGSMAERFNLIVRSSSSLWAGRIIVLPGEGRQAGGLIFPDQIAMIRAMPDVERVRLSVTLPYKGSPGTLPGFTPQINGVEPDALQQLPLQSGRHYEADETGCLIAGAEIADREGWRLGDTVWLEDRAFRLVGILQPTFSVVDDWLYLSVEDARRLLIENTPWLRAGVLEGSSSELMDLTARMATAIEVLPRPGVDVDVLAMSLQNELPELTALSPRKMQSIMGERLRLVNGLVLGSSLIGLLVGGVSILNTMLMSITERRAELAVKRAVGATAGHILVEVLAEAALVGLFGGLLGVSGGTLLAVLLNHLGVGGYTQLFHVTGRLILFALLFAVLLGSLAGLPPALRAARESPVDGLRYE